MIKWLWLLFVCNWTYSCCTADYIYPVDSYKKEGIWFIYLLYQSKKGLELLRLNSVTKEIHKSLSSRFIPTHIQVLPDGLGFSFTDQGIIWVKYLLKRSPFYLDMPIPLSNIDLINWKDAQTCFFSARYKGMYSLFELDINSNLTCLVTLYDYDCLYPQKMGDLLFFIAKDKKQQNFLLVTEYPRRDPSQTELTFDERVKQILYGLEHDTVPLKSSLDCEQLFSFEFSPLFLTMVSDSQGFVLEVYSVNDMVVLNYHQLIRADHSWEDSCLFSFTIPSRMISYSRDNTEGLYESVLPFLPYYDEGSYSLYYSHYDTCLQLYRYDLGTQESTLLMSSHTQSYFSPHIVDNMLVCGGIIDTRLASDYHQLPYMWFNDNGQVCLNLPILPNITK